MTTTARFNLRPYQQEALDSIPESGAFLICLATGLGKCFARGTPILMYDGNIKPVEQIREGELVMGADSTPRCVVGLAHGQEEMFKITPVKGEPYVVNESHILSLKITGISNSYNKRVTDINGNKYESGDICNISVRDYLKCSKTFRHIAKGWRTGVDFSEKEVTIPPYILGLWLGDGCSYHTQFTTMDKEVVKAFTDYCNVNSMLIRPGLHQNAGKALTYLIRGRSTKHGSNKLKKELENYNLMQNKHIPYEYLVNAREIRLELLAGLLDADGYIVDGNVFEVATSKEVMRDGILFLTRSLGLAAYSTDKIVKGKTYYRINISGDTHLIPTRIPRRKALPRKQKKNVLHTGIKVESVGVGEYFGFELEGNDKLFLLGDFTVVHNTVTFSQVPRRGRMLILSHRDELVHQPQKYFDCSFGVEQAEETSHGEEIVSASVQSLVRRLDKFKPDDFDVMVTDECFPAGTLVDGRPIEDIKVGDYVTAYNHVSGRIEKRKVTHTFKRPSPQPLIRINDILTCTLNHPVWDASREKYIQAQKLDLYGWLLYEDGIDGIHKLEVVEATSEYVYNLEVETLNNYFANGILVHNCHHATAPTYRQIYDYFKPRLHLGFTATPNRNDGIGLKDIYQDIIFERNMKWGIENGYLSPIQCLRVEMGFDLRRVAVRLGDYAPEALDKAVNIEDANEAVAETYKLYAKPPCLIFCASVAHAENLANLIDGAVAVKGGQDRSEIVKAFSNGEIPCLTNCMVFTEGTDIPNINTVIMARPTKNMSLYQQMVGRSTRLYPGKEYALLIDCVGAGDEADFCTAPSLLGLDIKDVPPKMRGQLQGNLFDLPEIAESVMDTPEVWIKNVQRVELWAKKNNYNTHGINFFKMADGSMVVQDIHLPPEDSLGRIEWLGRSEPAQKVFDAVFELLKSEYSEQRALWDLSLTKNWGSYPASEKQKAAIKKKIKGFDVSNLTKFEAGQILTRLFAPEPPTSKQIYFLQARGYDVSKLTRNEASKIIGRLKSA